VRRSTVVRSSTRAIKATRPGRKSREVQDCKISQPFRSDRFFADHRSASCTIHALPAFHPIERPRSKRGRLSTWQRIATLLLSRVEELTCGQQIELYDWLSARQGDVQVISITEVALEERVHDGCFLEALLYRLSVVRLEAALDNAHLQAA
jgi:hypothetical protein